MSLITISGRLGCGRMEIAKIVADKLSLEIFDDRRFQEAAIKLGIREEDLKGHMRGEPGEGEDMESKREEKEKDERVRLLLERDNQVRHSLQLLQTWNIFSQIRTTP